MECLTACAYGAAPLISSAAAGNDALPYVAL
jgi:hypothetical protein